MRKWPDGIDRSPRVIHGPAWTHQTKDVGPSEEMGKNETEEDVV